MLHGAMLPRDAAAVARPAVTDAAGHPVCQWQRSSCALHSSRLGRSGNRGGLEMFQQCDVCRCDAMLVNSSSVLQPVPAWTLRERRSSVSRIERARPGLLVNVKAVERLCGGRLCEGVEGGTRPQAAASCAVPWLTCVSTQLQSSKHHRLEHQ